MNCLDIKTTYQYWIQKLYPWSPERYLKKTNTVTWTELQAERFQFLHDLVRPAACLVLKNKTSAITLPQKSSRAIGHRRSKLSGAVAPSSLQHSCTQLWLARHCGGGKCHQYLNRQLPAAQQQRGYIPHAYVLREKIDGLVSI